MNNQPEGEEKKVLTKTLKRVYARLNLTRAELIAILGLSESSLSRLFSKTYFINPSSKEGDLTILLIRFYKNLDILFGGNIDQCRLWLRSENIHLNDIPINLIQSIKGLVDAIDYLEAMRGNK